MITHQCPHCGREITNSEAAAGWEIACPHCRRNTTVPQSSTIATSAVPTRSFEQTPPVEPTAKPVGTRPTKLLLLLAVPVVAAAIAALLAGTVVWSIIGILGLTLVAGAMLGMFKRLVNGIPIAAADLATVGYAAVVLAIWFGAGYWFQVGHVYVDNFSGRELRVVVDDRDWLTLRSTSTTTKSLGPGRHRITVLSKENQNLQEMNVDVKREGVYVLNLLRAEKYHKGDIEYGGLGFGGSRPTEISEAWFEAKVDYLFEKPPETITVSTKRGQPSFGATRTYLQRGPSPGGGQ